LDRIGKPGLSVLIPYPDKEINLRGCANSVIRYYFFPILAGQLIAEFKFDGKQIRLDALNLGDYLKKSQWAEKQGLPGLMDLARWAIQTPKERFIRLKEPPPGKRPKLTEELFGPDQLDWIRRDFAAGRRLAFHVPVSVLKQSGAHISHTGFSVLYHALDRRRGAQRQPVQEVHLARLRCEPGAHPAQDRRRRPHALQREYNSDRGDPKRFQGDVDRLRYAPRSAREDSSLERAMIRKINFTGRKKIKRTNVRVDILRDADGRRFFNLHANLSDLRLPPNARISAEAYRRTAYQRLTASRPAATRCCLSNTRSWATTSTAPAIRTLIRLRRLCKACGFIAQSL
jgi:hypothetical protein